MSDEISGPKAKRGRGQPPFEPTEADFDKVHMLLALDWTNEQIANALGISQPTLRKYFSAQIRERDRMRDRVEGERLASLYASAKAGRITAIRELGRVLGSDEAAHEAALNRAASRPAADKAAKLGKKEANRVAALDAEEELARLYSGTMN
ncbi:hypothetical protein [Rubellimicrobium arenae]|uniref:hypothetical protein n=1 Tax=Rubellimicrobium arenae TaxID=2817372 RepID=UPI001B311337|nr:hypothetical protein [Rubellimicrobium arenae]